jgi:O-antigen ligase/polysaccharide polymerase Wzy-like membrane protein
MLVGRSVRLSVLIAVGVAAISVAVSIGRIPAAVAVIAGAVIASGLVDLPNRLIIGAVTGQAVLTTVLFVVASLVSLDQLQAVPASARRACLPFIAFLCYAVVSTGWGGWPSSSTIQNLVVFALFPALICCSALVASRESNVVGSKTITLALVLALALGLGNLVLGGFGSSVLVGSRSWGLIALILIAWTLAHARIGSRRDLVIAVVLSAIVVAGLSRTAFACALLLFIVAFLDLKTPERFARFALTLAVVIGAGYWAVTSFAPLRHRFDQGDVRRIGALSLNLSGREQFWSFTWHGFLRRPIFGHGLGASERAIDSAFGVAIGHPHNDFLRLLFDFGVVGAALWCVGYVLLTREVVRRRRRSREPVHTAALLVLVALPIAMFTDNVLVYSFVIAPAAVIVGLSLGAPIPTGPKPVAVDTSSSLRANGWPAQSVLRRAGGG